jgi:site-specific DNA-cytosine methylase
VDLVGADVRRRHWPDALQIASDVRTINPLALPPITLLCGGFPCTDLSCAGPQPEDPLDTGDRSGLYLEVLRFARVLRPRIVVVENVPAIHDHQWRIERDFRRLGYGLTWVRCGAWDAGAPHIRRRVFVVAEQGTIGRGVVDADDRGRWTGDRVWPTPTEHGNANRAGLSFNSGDGLATVVRVWPTIRATVATPEEAALLVWESDAALRPR